MPKKKKFSKTAFTEDIDSRIRQRASTASSNRKGSVIRRTNEAILTELQDLRKTLVGEPLNLND